MTNWVRTLYSLTRPKTERGRETITASGEIWSAARPFDDRLLKARKSLEKRLSAGVTA